MHGCSKYSWNTANVTVCHCRDLSHHDPAIVRHLHGPIADQHVENWTAFQDVDVSLDELCVEVDAPHLIITRHYTRTDIEMDNSLK